MWKIKEVNVFMKTILKRTIVFFLSLAMIISVACSTAVAAETLEDQNVTSHRVSYMIYSFCRKKYFSMQTYCKTEKFVFTFLIILLFLRFMFWKN